MLPIKPRTNQRDITSSGMGAIAEWIDNLELFAESPDRTVRARRRGCERIEVKLSPKSWSRHSTASLAGQVEVVVKEILVAQNKAIDKQRFGDRDPVELVKEANDFAKRQLEFRKAAAEIASVGTSHAGLVKIGWRGTADIQVRIAPDTISKLNRAQLTHEINSGIAAVMRSRSREILRLSDQFYGPVPYPPNKGGSLE